MALDYPKLAKTIDHALLTPTLSEAELEAGLLLARVYQVASVCILPYYVARAADVLRGSGVRVSTTIAFPHGAQATPVKLVEAETALGHGAEELDVVVNLSQVRSGKWETVRADLAAMIQAAHSAKARVKVIFENAYLNQDQKLRLCDISTELAADWVKTSTGFGPSGATLEDVQTMRARVGASVQVKAAGGVRDLDTLLEFLPWITRCGTSRTREILDECRRRVGLPVLDDAAFRSATPGSGY